MREEIKILLIPAVIFAGIAFSMVGLPMLIYNVFWAYEYNVCIGSGGDPVLCAKELKSGN